jgi:hypothetical protein
MSQGSTTRDAKILCMMNYRVKSLLEGILNIIEIRNWVNTSLSGTTRNHLKEWIKNQKWSNHFLGPNPSNIFKNMIFFFLCLSIACTNLWFEVYFEILKNDFFRISNY